MLINGLVILEKLINNIKLLSIEETGVQGKGYWNIIEV